MIGKNPDLYALADKIAIAGGGLTGRTGHEQVAQHKCYCVADGAQRAERLTKMCQRSYAGEPGHICHQTHLGHSGQSAARPYGQPVFPQRI
jgi:hypothetical protein